MFFIVAPWQLIKIVSLQYSEDHFLKSLHACTPISFILRSARKKKLQGNNQRPTKRLPGCTFTILCISIQWRTQKVSEGAKVLSQSCDVKNQLGECRRHNYYRVVRGHAPKKFCKITPKNTHFRTGQIESFSKTKKAFAQWWIFKFRGPRQEFPKIDVL